MIGTLVGIVMFVLGQKDLMNYFGYEKLWTLHYTINVGVSMLISVIVFVVVSLLTEPPTKDQIEMYTYRRGLIGMGMEGLPWYQDYRTHIVVLLALIGYILVMFW